MNISQYFDTRFYNGLSIKFMELFSPIVKSSNIHLESAIPVYTQTGNISSVELFNRL